MTPTDFAETNIIFIPPPSLEESQCSLIRAYKGEILQGSVEGSPVIVTAWQPSPEERERIAQGAPIFLTMLMDGLPPHFLTTSFYEATNPQ